MAHLERKGWLLGGRGYLQIKIFDFFVNKKKNREKLHERRENTRNLVLIGEWQPC